MAALNYAQQYAQELANIYPYLSYFSEVWTTPNNRYYKPQQGKIVHVPTLIVSGARDVDRDSIELKFTRGFDNQWQALVMSMDREWDTLVDPVDVDETNQVTTIANITKVYNETQKIPEMDTYAASKIASFANDFGGIDTTSLAAANILGQWDAALAYFADQRVPRSRIVCKVTPTVYSALKQATGITRFVEAASATNPSVTRDVAFLDGVRIEIVPSDMMKTEYVYTSGWAIGSNAQQINMLLFDPLAIVAPIVYDTVSLDPPSATNKGKWLYYERHYYDVFKLNSRQAGFFANIGTPTLGELTVTSVAGDGAGKTVLTYTGDQIDANGNPYYGLDAYYTSNHSTKLTIAYNDKFTDSKYTNVTFTKCTGTNSIALSSQTGSRYAYVVLINKQTGKIVAAGDTTLVVGSAG